MGSEQRHCVPFLIAVAVDNHLTIGFSLALLDDCRLAVARFVLLDNGCSVAIAVAVIRANGFAGRLLRYAAGTAADTISESAWRPHDIAKFCAAPAGRLDRQSKHFGPDESGG
jgi:hypothetical protein